MTDNEIIKALKCCANRKKCSECPLCVTSTVPCSVRLATITLDLINRLQAENAKLEYDLHRAAALREKLMQVFDVKQEAIERLKENYNKAMDNLKSVLKERADHSEAIKDFAECICIEIPWTEIDISFHTATFIQNTIVKMAKERAEKDD